MPNNGIKNFMTIYYVLVLNILMYVLSVVIDLDLNLDVDCCQSSLLLTYALLVYGLL